MKWVVTSTVTPCSTRALMWVQNSRRVIGSTPEVGSSRNSTGGSCITAQARASRCLKPSGRVLAVHRQVVASGAKISIIRSMRVALRAAAQAIDAGEEIQVLRARSGRRRARTSAPCSRATARVGASRRAGRSRQRWPSPELGFSRPHSILKVVDLPAPLGPSRPKISPRGIAKVMLLGGREVAEALGQPVGDDRRIAAVGNGAIAARPAR